MSKVLRAEHTIQRKAIRRAVAGRTVAELLRLPEGREAVRALGERSYSAATELLAPRAVVAEAKAILTRRDARVAARQTPDPLTGLMDRLRERCRRETAQAVPGLGRIYRVYSGDRTTTLSHEPRCVTGTGTKWVSGRGGFGRVTNSQHTRLSVMPGWRTYVQDRGLAVLDGLLTTHAYLLDDADGIEVYRAAWVRQGRGYEISHQPGHVAYHRDSGTSYHLEYGDPDRARRGLSRKLAAQGVAPEVRDARRAERARKRAAHQAAGIARLAARLVQWDLSEIAHVEVRRVDSLHAGNCKPGTDQFAERYFAGREHATIGEIAARLGRDQLDLTVLSGDRLTFARQVAAACLVAIRRDRAARRSLALA